VHVLKIDRSFISQMTVDGRDAVIVRSINDLAHDLGLLTIAEGVEDQQTLDRLTALGCDVAQGYFLSRPVPAQQLEQWFDRTAEAALATSM
jgi:EAL domain-containing protein (putative c-di-GMP-specific phosphodiesterase class I)